MTRGRLITGAALAFALAASCGGERKGEEPKKDAPKPAAVDAEPKSATAEAPATEIAQEKISGKATQSAESGAGAESALSLTLGDGGRVGGELALGAARCSVFGMIEEAVVRAWLACPAAEGVTAKRGTLVGEVTGGLYTGTFAASDDGAANVVRGTWTAGK
jgi:hypothetical protein